MFFEKEITNISVPKIDAFKYATFRSSTSQIAKSIYVSDFIFKNIIFSSPFSQSDGTWTDIPRCIEHDPGVDEQIPGLCPGIPGYCSDGFIGHRCNFKCPVGPDIDSKCSGDGTWIPYPTCAGDLRETQDGCDGCPGPNGGKRNRTAEAILGNYLLNLQ